MRDQLFAAPENSNSPAILLLDAIVFLLQPELPWVCKIVGYFLERNAYALIRDITLTGKVHMNFFLLPGVSFAVGFTWK